MQKKYLFIIIAYLAIGTYSFFTAKIQPASFLEEAVSFIYYLLCWPAVILLYIFTLL